MEWLSSCALLHSAFSTCSQALLASALLLNTYLLPGAVGRKTGVCVASARATNRSSSAEAGSSGMRSRWRGMLCVRYGQAWRAGLVLGGENGAELSEEQIRSLQQGGYWQ